MLYQVGLGVAFFFCALINEQRVSVPGKTFCGSVQVRSTTQESVVTAGGEGRCRTVIPGTGRRSGSGAEWFGVAASR
jgi:hypothetical protein